MGKLIMRGEAGQGVILSSNSFSFYGFSPVPFPVWRLLAISFLTAHICVKLLLLLPPLSPGTWCSMDWGCVVADFYVLDPGRCEVAHVGHPVCCFLQCPCSPEFEQSLGSGADPASKLLPHLRYSWCWLHPQVWIVFLVLDGTLSGLVSCLKSPSNFQDWQKEQLLSSIIFGWVPTCLALPPESVSWPLFLYSLLRKSGPSTKPHSMFPMRSPASLSLGGPSFSCSTVFMPLCPSGPGWPEDSTSSAPVIGSRRACDPSWISQSHQSFPDSPRRNEGCVPSL